MPDGSIKDWPDVTFEARGWVTDGCLPRVCVCVQPVGVLYKNIALDVSVDSPLPSGMTF